MKNDDTQDRKSMQFKDIDGSVLISCGHIHAHVYTCSHVHCTIYMYTLMYLIYW